MDELEWLNYENQEMTLSESMIVLESMISVLGLIIKKDIFEQLVGYSDRRQILNLLTSVKEYLIYLKDWSDYRTYFIQDIQSLFTFLSKYNFEIQVDWYPDYQKKIQEVKDLKLRYQCIPMHRSILHKYCKNYAILQSISVLKIIQQNSLDFPQRNSLFILFFPKINPHNFFKMKRWESWFMLLLLVSARALPDFGSKKLIFKQSLDFKSKRF